MKKLIIFDLDGVLIDSRELHFDAFNESLKEVDSKYMITLKEHLSIYDGLPTNKKLERLTLNKNLPETFHKQIWKRKQEITLELLSSEVVKDDKLIEIFSYLKSQNHIICVASNSIKATIDLILNKKEITNFVDYIVSNEDVEFPKPNPQMYLKCMCKFGTSPKNTVVVEDSYVGRTAAFESGAIVCPVKNSTELTLPLIKSYLGKSKTNMKWINKNLNVLIPMAGEGSRFSKAGYTFPKPLVEVFGKPMIQLVIENLNIDANFIFIIRKEHDKKFGIKSLLNQIVPECEIVDVDTLTDGAACTTLLAKEFIDNDQELLIANSDQYVVWDSCEFYHSMNSEYLSGGILTFENNHPKWSYVKLDENNNVTEVKEKEVISNQATIGIYHWSKGSDYVKYAEQMISKDIRYGSNFNGKGEFYVAPVYNEAILDGKVFKTYGVKKMFGLGTPEDLNYFLENFDETK